MVLRSKPTTSRSCTWSLAYVVVSEGGIGGAGETLRAVAPGHLRLKDDTVCCDLSEAEWNALPRIEGDQWPAAAPGQAAAAHE